MSNQSIDEIAEQAHQGEDVSKHFTGRFQAKQQVNVTLPLDLLQRIDAECERQKMSRQDWIAIACSDKMHATQAHNISKAV